MRFALRVNIASCKLKVRITTFKCINNFKQLVNRYGLVDVGHKRPRKAKLVNKEAVVFTDNRLASLPIGFQSHCTSNFGAGWGLYLWNIKIKRKNPNIMLIEDKVRCINFALVAGK